MTARRRPTPPPDALIDAPAWGRRRHERNADAVIRTIRSSGEWDDRWDLAASTLRAAARAVDIAEQCAQATPTSYAAQTLSMCARELREVVAAFGLGMTGGGAPTDDFARFLVELAADPAGTPADHPATP